jgi:hypothetical protein
VWDSTLAPVTRAQNESLLALADAIAMRGLLLTALPEIECAVLRVFRQPARLPPEMIILGTISRELPAIHRVTSLVMRAKVYGFCFNWEDGVLQPLQGGRRTEEVITVEE